MTTVQAWRSRLVEPKTLKGFQNHLPEDMISRNRVVGIIREVYERYGFQPIDTPVLEHLVTLIGTGGEETNKQLFRMESPEREPIAMRFDLTVSFARLLAEHPDKIKLPFRRYHIGPVFRADKPGPGRFRQFTQCDIDAAGAESVAVDAEIVAAMSDVFTALGLAGTDSNAGKAEYQIRVNSRNLMDALLEGGGIADAEVKKHVLRVVDKLQKVGMDNARKELGEGRVDESGDPIRGVGLPNATIEKILAFISVKAESRRAVLEGVRRVLPSSATTDVAVQGMMALADALDSLAVGEKAAVFDPTLARGLDYYTGPVFEGLLTILPEYGSVMGGGRFDQLVRRFLDIPVPVTGASIGLDRLIAALQAAGKLDAPATVTKVLVLSLKGVRMPDLLKVARELRAARIPTEVFMSDAGTGMRSQLSFANARGIPIAVIIGEDELRSGTVAVKDLITGGKKRTGIEDHEAYVKAGQAGQIAVRRSELVGAVTNMLRGWPSRETRYGRVGVPVLGDAPLTD
ncbi:MAG: histidine--tRNA ligase [Verrucomicrobiota bacterium]|nr:histidine--tRNA ligase [Verrucomicrobiota bacterium]